MYIQQTDGISYRMKEPFDFGFLKKYGRVFKAFDDQDSGNICFGLKDGQRRLFLKFAGAPTARGSVSTQAAIENLRATLPVYSDLAHDNLIRLVDHGEMGGGYALVFEWVDAICMGRMYPEQHEEFMRLPVAVRSKIFEDIVRFHICAAQRGYAAVDLYDGTVMYDIENHRTVLCDIDFYRRAPFVNDMGRMWGSERFMSPEEFTLGAVIDEVTNVYTVGAMAFAMFANYSREAEAWTLSEEKYLIAKKAVSDNRKERWGSLSELLSAWTAAR